MKTTIYLIRHSKANENIEYFDNFEKEFVKNQKRTLSVEGESNAKKLASNSFLKRIDYVLSSNYVRTISTAKYIAYNNNTKTIITDFFNERNYGIEDLSMLPDDYYERQFKDATYKFINGESREEVAERMNYGLYRLLSLYKGKNIAIVTHASAISFLLMSMKDLKLEFSNKKIKITFKKEVVFNNYIYTPEVFKLIFNDNQELIEISNIRPNNIKRNGDD